MKLQTIAALILFYASTASAGTPNSTTAITSATGPTAKELLARVQESKGKVILAVTDSGKVAADTAWLLSAQVNKDPSYTPVFVVLKPDERDSVLKTLKLSEGSLPALIYYNRQGSEVSRVIGALPSHLIKQVRSNNGNEMN